MWLLAHAAPINYKFPLPIWLYVLAGGVAVLVSAPAAALGVRTSEPREWRSRDISRLGRPLRPAVTALLGVLLVYGIVFGLAASNEQSHEFFENPMTVLTWVDFWVGLGLLATFVGNLWDSISPLNAAMRALDAALARRGVAQRAYPVWLGRWPAVVLVVVWSWMELVWDPAKNPVWLAAIVLVYCLGCLAAAALYGAEPWLENVELFTVVSRTFSRVSPLELRGGEARLRPYGAGLRTDPPLPAGGGAFVLALLATVIYDGFSQTSRFTQLAGKLIDAWGWLGVHADVLRTIVLVGVVVVFVGLYVAVCALMRGGGNAFSAASEYAPTLVPIAAVYFAAHYFTYFLIAGQATLGTIIDPLGHSWNPWGLGEYPLHKGFLLPVAVWWTQVVVIVWGHVLAVLAAHRVALGRRLAPRRTLAFQAPLVLLMVAFTMAGLWVLAQQVKAA